MIIQPVDAEMMIRRHQEIQDTTGLGSSVAAEALLALQLRDKRARLAFGGLVIILSIVFCSFLFCRSHISS
jgi:hypothetical protein